LEVIEFYFIKTVGNLYICCTSVLHSVALNLTLSCLTVTQWSVTKMQQSLPRDAL